MKLQAVSICVNYSDFLASVICNKRHFDRWVVVTCADDRRTQEQCKLVGIECLVSVFLNAGGNNFHAADFKWQILNEGLDALNPSGWVLVLDADVLLPRHFRERIEALPLELGCLYGVAGRKVIETREPFDQLRACEPWTAFVARNSSILGYFNLFSLEAEPNRYPKRELSESSKTHDDWRFARSFDDDRHRMLPMTVIHIGLPRINWEGRSAQEFEAPKIGNDISKSLLEIETYFARSSVHSPSIPKAAAIIGYFPGGRWSQVARRFSRVWVVDHFQIHTSGGHPMWEADRIQLQHLLRQETADMGHLEWLRAHSVQNLTRISDSSVDLLYLPGEVSPDSLVKILHFWKLKLRDEAIICGDLYGLPHWREATFSLSLLVGPPDCVARNGFWWKRIRRTDWKNCPSLPDITQFFDQDGAVLLNRSGATVEKALISIGSVRRHWTGPLVVYHWGEEDPSLALACGMLGALLCNVGEERQESDSAWLKEAALIQPFRRALLLPPETLVVGSLSDLFVLRVTHTNGEPALPMLAIRDKIEEVPVVVNIYAPLADSFLAMCNQPLLLCVGDVNSWTNEAWEAWCSTDATLSCAFVSEIRVANDVTAMTIVDSNLIGDFQRNLLTWNFSSETPLLVILVGVSDSLWLPCATPRIKVLSLSAQQADDLPALFQLIASESKTRRIVFLPGTAAALPGAELCIGDQWQCIHAIIHRTWSTQSEFDLTGNRFLPLPFCGMIERTFVENMATSELAANSTLHDLPMVIDETLRQGINQVSYTDLNLKGWRFPSTHLYVTSDSQSRQTNETRINVRQDGNGYWLLADDVVVISLPERNDRRERICDAMNRNKVKFRFVEGVRVTDRDIEPDEISEVHLHSFKVARGVQSFLRGTVGCRRAHLRCLEEAYRAGLDSLLLVEDDMHWVERWLDRYIASVAELPRGWLQLYLSSGDFKPSQSVSANLHRLGGAYQTTAILYSAAGIEAALKSLRHSRCEIDVWMGNHLHPFGCSYAIRPGICFQKGGVSDILSYDRGITP